MKLEDAREASLQLRERLRERRRDGEKSAQQDAADAAKGGCLLSEVRGLLRECWVAVMVQVDGWNDCFFRTRPSCN